MNEAKYSTNNVKDPEEEIIEALPEEEQERLVEKGTLVAFIDADGSTKYRIPTGFNRLLSLPAGGETDVTRGVGDQTPASPLDLYPLAKPARLLLSLG
jgi:hypothetical protein